MKKLILAGAIFGSLMFTNNVMAAEYIVKSGDSLWGISSKHNLSVTELKALNGLNSDTIYPGQSLKLSSASTSSNVSNTNTYTLKSGDYLSVIAKNRGIILNQLLNMNPNIKEPNLVKIGQVINVPSTDNKSITNATPLTESKTVSVPSNEVGISNHTVQTGEYLSVIARDYGISYPILLAFNPQISNPNYVRVGDVVKIPNKDLVLLSKIIYLEAQGEPFEGKIAVGNVIMNRVDYPYFPNTVREVIYQKDQFTPVKNGDMPTAVPKTPSVQAAKLSYSGERNVVGDALFFYAPAKTDDSFVHSREVVTTIGGHRFAK